MLLTSLFPCVLLPVHFLPNRLHVRQALFFSRLTAPHPGLGIRGSMIVQAKIDTQTAYFLTLSSQPHSENH